MVKNAIKSLLTKVNNNNFNAFCPTGMVPYNFK